MVAQPVMQQGFLSFSWFKHHSPLTLATHTHNFSSTYHSIFKYILCAIHYVNLFIYISSFYPHKIQSDISLLCGYYGCITNILSLRSLKSNNQEFQKGLSGEFWLGVSPVAAAVYWLQLKSSKGLTRTRGPSSRASKMVPYSVASITPHRSLHVLA